MTADAPTPRSLRYIGLALLALGATACLDPAWRFLGTYEGTVRSVDTPGRMRESYRARVELDDGSLVVAAIDGVRFTGLSTGDRVVLTGHESLIFRLHTYVGHAARPPPAPAP